MACTTMKFLEASKHLKMSRIFTLVEGYILSIADSQAYNYRMTLWASLADLAVLKYCAKPLAI